MVTSGSDGTGWSSAATAAAYAEFGAQHGMYERTSADLVDRLDIAGVERVLDLCCGTGVTTRCLLRRLPVSATVVAVDGSPEMLAQARDLDTSGRVEWVCARAEELRPALTGTVDAVVCNSAIWQTVMPKTLAAVAEVLRPGGQFVFNIGRRFLVMPFTDDELQPRKPGLTEVMSALATLEFDYAPAMAPRGGPMRTPEAVVELLRSSGFEPSPPEVVDLGGSFEEFLAWLRIPIFTEPLFPGLSYEQRMVLLDRAVDRVAPGAQPARSPWVVFAAARRA